MKNFSNLYNKTINNGQGRVENTSSRTLFEFKNYVLNEDDIFNGFFSGVTCQISNLTLKIYVKDEKNGNRATQMEMFDSKCVNFSKF